MADGGALNMADAGDFVVFEGVQKSYDGATLVVKDVNGGVKLGHGEAQNRATLGLRGMRVMGGGQSAALSV